MLVSLEKDLWGVEDMKANAISKPLTEAFFLQVSVRREFPQTAKDFIQDEPEDWTLAFPEVKLQVFFLLKAKATSGTAILLFCVHTVQNVLSKST